MLQLGTGNKAGDIKTDQIHVNMYKWQKEKTAFKKKTKMQEMFQNVLNTEKKRKLLTY